MRGVWRCGEKVWHSRRRGRVCFLRDEENCSLPPRQSTAELSEGLVNSIWPVRKDLAIGLLSWKFFCFVQCLWNSDLIFPKSLSTRSETLAVRGRLIEEAEPLDFSILLTEQHQKTVCLQMTPAGPQWISQRTVKQLQVAAIVAQHAHSQSHKKSWYLNVFTLLSSQTLFHPNLGKHTKQHS